jgi:hypothetical protein
MKKIILTVAAVFAFGFANAQDTTIPAGNGFAKGNKFVEGSFGFSSQDSNLSADVAKSTWALNPSMGYMLDNQWAVGGRLNFGGAKYNNNTTTTDLGITAFARYYFLSLGASKSFQAYGEVGVGYTSTTVDPKVADKYTDGSLNANIDLGLNYFFTSHWAATFELANILSYKNAKPDGEDSTSDLTVQVNLFKNIFAQPTFGLLYRW